MLKHQPLTLWHNFSWMFVGNLVYASCQWGILVVLAKLSNPETVGQFALGFAITAPVIIFTNLSLREVQATDAKHQFRFGHYLLLRLLTSGFALFVILFILSATGYRRETALVILLVGLGKVLESISDVFHSLLQQQERMDRIGISLIIKGLLSVVFLGLGIYLTHSVVWATVGLVIAWGSVLVLYDIPISALTVQHSRFKSANSKHKKNDPSIELQPCWQPKSLRQLLWLTLPLGFIAMLHSLSISIPRYLTEHYLGEKELGIFSAILYLVVAGNVLVSALGQSASPRLAEYFVTGNRKGFTHLLFKLTGIGMLLGSTSILVSIILGKQILALLYEAEYAQHVNLLIWVMAGAAISYTFFFLEHAIIAARCLRIQIPLYILVNLISILVCFWLIPTMKLQGAAIALIATTLSQSIMSLGVIYYVLHNFPTPEFTKKF